MAARRHRAVAKFNWAVIPFSCAVDDGLLVPIRLSIAGALIFVEGVTKCRWRQPGHEHRDANPRLQLQTG